MKLPTFDNKTARWDRFKRFHNEPEPNLIVFESGEVLLWARDFNPDHRGMTRKLGRGESDLRVVSSVDRDCPALSLGKDSLTPEARAVLALCRQDADALAAKPLPKAWINGGGSQLLLLDASTGRSVGIGGDYRNAEGRNAAWQWAAAWSAGGTNYYNQPMAYIPGPQSKAVGDNIPVRVPVKHTPEEKKALHDLHAACTVWCQMGNDDAYKLAPKYYSVPRWGAGRSLHQPYLIPDLPNGMDTELADLAPERIFQIRHHGFERSTHTMQVECLYAAL
jgi:hypothetical protein